MRLPRNPPFRGCCVLGSRPQLPYKLWICMCWLSLQCSLSWGGSASGRISGYHYNDSLRLPFAMQSLAQHQHQRKAKSGELQILGAPRQHTCTLPQWQTCTGASGRALGKKLLKIVIVHKAELEILTEKYCPREPFP